jgi:hypothetical protein
LFYLSVPNARGPRGCGTELSAPSKGAGAPNCTDGPDFPNTDQCNRPDDHCRHGKTKSMSHQTLPGIASVKPQAKSALHLLSLPDHYELVTKDDTGGLSPLRGANQI